MSSDQRTTFLLGKDPALREWENQFLASNTQEHSAPMSVGDTQTLLGLALDEVAVERGVPSRLPLSEPVFKAPIVLMLRSRLARLGVAITPQAVIFVSLLCKGSPGSATMYAQGLYRLFEDRGRVQLNTEALAMAFPIGFPTEARLQALWDMQKCSTAPNSNMLDGVVVTSPST